MIIKWSTAIVLIAILKNVYCGGEDEVHGKYSKVQFDNDTETESTTIQPDEPNDVVVTNITKVPILEGSPLDEFPDDFFTDEQRSNGAIIVHIFAALYFFILLTIVCDEYFLPSVECVCEDLNISKDVAAITFMASATIMPEFCANIASTLLADSEIGLGGVLGSLMFNILGVAGCAGMAVTHYIQFDWWPVTRDCLLYGCSVCVLIAVVWDSQVTLIESTVMVSLVSMYFLFLLFNKRVMHTLKWIMEINLNCCRLQNYDLPTSFVESNLKNAITLGPNDLRQMTNMSEKPKILHGSLSRSSLDDKPIFMIYANSTKIEKNPDESCEKKDKSLWSCPLTNKLKTLWWIFTWPIKCLLTLTIPNPKTYRRMYPLTFIMCIIWVGLNSYLIVWMMTVIGYTFGVSDLMMGYTALAFGNCLPEALSSILMIRKGERGVGVSNSLGSSTLDILLSLGATWFVKNLLELSSENPNPSIDITGIESTIFLLLASVILLYVILAIAKYRLSKLVGVCLILGYSILATLSVMMQSGAFSKLINE